MCVCVCVCVVSLIHRTTRRGLQCGAPCHQRIIVIGSFLRMSRLHSSVSRYTFALGWSSVHPPPSLRPPECLTQTIASFQTLILRSLISMSGLAPFSPILRVRPEGFSKHGERVSLLAALKASFCLLLFLLFVLWT